MQEIKRFTHHLKRIRKVKEMSQGAVAKKANLSLSHFQDLENGNIEAPSWDSIESIAQALKLSPCRLTSPAPVLHSVRLRVPKRVPAHEQVLMDIDRWYHHYCLVEELLNENCSNKFERLKSLANKPLSDYLFGAREAGEEVRNALIGPVPHRENFYDLFSLLEHNGVKLGELSVSSLEDFFSLSFKARGEEPAIVVNIRKDISVEQMIFAAVMELCHLLFHDEDYDTEESKVDKKKEKQAYEFACFFLMPEELFRKKWDETLGFSFVDRVIKIKRFFGVSYKSVLHRLAEEHQNPGVWKRFYVKFLEQHKKSIISTKDYDRLCEGFVPYGLPEAQSSQEPYGLSRWSTKAFRFKSLVRTAVVNRQISMSRGAELLGVFVDDMYLG